MSQEISHHISVWFGIKGLECIQKLVETVGKATNRPIFRAHITVLGSQTHLTLQQAEVAIKKVLGKLQLKPFELVCKDLVLDTLYYKCVYITVEPNSMMKQINEALIDEACTKHGIAYVTSSSAPFQAHISLVYGNTYLSDTENLNELQPILSAFNISEEEIKENKCIDIKNRQSQRFLVDSFLIMDCDLVDVSSWKLLKRIDLPTL